MAIELNHTIVHARDPLASATHLAEVLGRTAPVKFGPFWDVELDNHVTLAYILADEHLTIEHYAFLVSEEEFDGSSSAFRREGCRTGPTPTFVCLLLSDQIAAFTILWMMRREASNLAVAYPTAQLPA